MVKISIIMTINNTEYLVERTVESIIKQTIKDIEVICVDCNSDSGVLRRLSEEYDFIKVFRTTEISQSEARNYGLSKANGEYVAFITSKDQYMDQNALEKRYMYPHKNDADMVCGNIQVIKQDGSVDKSYDRKSSKFNYFLKKDVLEPVEYGTPEIFNKNIYKRSFLTQNGFEFSNDITFDDPIFMAKVLTNIRDLYVINTDFYGLNNNIDLIDTYDKKYEYIKQFKEVFDILSDAEFESPLASYKKEFINYIEYKNNLKDEEISEITTNLFTDAEEYFKDEEDRFIIELLKNSKVDSDFDDFSNLKKEMFEETLTSDNFIGYDQLYNYIKCKEQLKQKHDNVEIKKASYMALKDISNEVLDEREILNEKNKKMDKDIASRKHVKNEILSSNSWKITSILRKIRNL